jgi:hypothetical protein
MFLGVFISVVWLFELFNYRWFWFLKFFFNRRIVGLNYFRITKLSVLIILESKTHRLQLFKKILKKIDNLPLKIDKVLTIIKTSFWNIQKKLRTIVIYQNKFLFGLIIDCRVWLVYQTVFWLKLKTLDNLMMRMYLCLKCGATWI